MQFDEIFNQLQSLFPAVKRSEAVDAGDTWIEVAVAELDQIAQTLRDAPQFAFDMLNCISGVDYLHTDPKLAAKATWQPHLEVVYHLTSTTHRHRLVLKVILPRWENDTPGELPEVPSVAHLWATADWHEREVFDLMGVHFVGHPHLVRILCPEDWVGYPLRKDYEMPLEYHGIRGR